MKTIKRSVIFLCIFALLILSLSLVSAGLCKGDNGYYKDCNYNENSKYKTEKEKTISLKPEHRELIEEHYESGFYTGHELGYYKSFYENYKDFEDKNWEYYDTGYYAGYDAGLGLYEGFRKGLDKGYDYGKERGYNQGFKEAVDKWYDKGYDAGYDAGDDSSSRTFGYWRAGRAYFKR